MKKPFRLFLVLAVLLGLITSGPGRPALGQLSASEDDRLQILTDPDALKKKLEKDKTRAPFEFIHSQVAPFDVLPFLKPHHWSTVFVDLRANNEDYEGSLQFFPVALAGMPQAMIYARDARLTKEQRSRLGSQVLIPRTPRERELKELNVELLRTGAIRSDDIWAVPLRTLPPAQMLVVILSKESSSQYASWNRLPCFFPGSVDREDTIVLDLQRYYRLVLPENADKPFLSPHPLTWGPISHIVWDGLAPDALPVSHQEALLDWLHWGGQLVLIGGAGPSFSIFRESFLDGYLPADETGESVLLGESELNPLAQAYPPTVIPAAPPQDEQEGAPAPRRPAPPPAVMGGKPYLRVAPIQPPKSRPVFLSGLRPRPGAATIPLGDNGSHLLAVESRVGRGRITMMAINPTDPSIAAWPGLDTLVRRVVLRRPEEPMSPRGILDGPDLSWYRITSRDQGAEAEAERLRGLQMQRSSPSGPAGNPYQPPPVPSQPSAGGSTSSEAEEAAMSRAGVAEWRDTTAFPRLCRDVLEKASGISVPSSRFVLKVILAYLLAVVPLNWLIFRLLFNRRELAWVVVPLLALGFAVGVERMAAYDMGYDSACDEIDLLELQEGYSRAHLSRFASLYTTGRAKYTISYPNDPTALALPFNNERSIGGEEFATAVWRSYPVPALQSYSVQPRSLAMFRAEQMLGLSGPIALEGTAGARRLLNQSELELRDVVLIDLAPGKERQTYLGTIAPGASIVLDGTPALPFPDRIDGHDGPDPAPILTALRTSSENRPESSGELRLVAWVPRPLEGQAFDPALDRHRGMTAVLVHLRYSPPPSPAGPRYNLLAPAAEKGE